MPELLDSTRMMQATPRVPFRVLRKSVAGRLSPLSLILAVVADGSLTYNKRESYIHGTCWVAHAWVGAQRGTCLSPHTVPHPPWCQAD